MGPDLPVHIAEIIAASYAKSSWCKLSSALNALNNFATETKFNVTFPIQQITLLNFAAWGHNVKNWKASTISAYISSIATIHRLRNIDDSSCNDWLTNQLIQGVENMEMYTVNPKETRKVMTLPLLIILGNQIATSDWTELSKQLVWTAATLAFFGSMRFGELLPENKNSYCPDDTLLWSDIKSLNKDSFLIHVKTPKSKAKEGEFVDIFPFEGFGVCPVAALKQLKSLCSSDQTKPVFMFSDGHFLTKNCMNDLIKQLMTPLLGPEASNLKCHSFRGAIPSAIGKCPALAGEKETKGWGRWSSSAYLLYSRLKLDQKRSIFQKILTILGLQASPQQSQPRL
jgi:hypothetical protein